MERFYCDIWGQEINKHQCHFWEDSLRYSTTPACLNCPIFKVTPDKLRAFVQNLFRSMLKFEEKQKIDRRSIRPMWKKQESAERMQARRTGKVREKRDEIRSIRESVIKGKEKTYTNLLVFELNYLLNREMKKGNQEIIEKLKIYDEVDVYKWIAIFLAQNGYKKHNRKDYTGKDIRKIVESLEKKEDALKNKAPEYPMKDWYQSLCDYELLEFVQRT